MGVEFRVGYLHHPNIRRSADIKDMTHKNFQAMREEIDTTIVVTVLH
ncbi:hypothetical protein [Stutzerimonas nosocomialis]|nr:hypothetical protein [Stutzerimonas nosocomialis]